jgi:DNA-binding transcriptional LysR family regulator
VLFISQPAISKHIKALEAHYKTTLFEERKCHSFKPRRKIITQPAEGS